MALGKKYSDNSTSLFLRIKTKETDPETKKEIPLVPHLFEISEKVNGTWKVRENKEDTVTGVLSNIRFDKDEYDGEPYDIVQISLKDTDANETYILDLRFTMVTRNLFNSILNLTNFTDPITVSLYKKESKKKQGDYFTNVSLWQNDELVKGLFALDEIPQPDPIKDRKGVVIKNDYTETNNFFLDALKEFALKFGKKATKSGTAPTEKKASAPKTKATDAKSKPDSTESSDSSPIDDDIPF